MPVTAAEASVRLAILRMLAKAGPDGLSKSWLNHDLHGQFRDGGISAARIAGPLADLVERGQVESYPDPAPSGYRQRATMYRLVRFNQKGG